MHLSCGVAGRIGDAAAIAEPRWLHQVLLEDGGGRADDLEEAARDPAWRARRGRVHFHVPIYAERLASGLETTRPALEAALEAALASAEPVPDLEIETYSWSALPVADRPAELSDGIAREMEYVLAKLGAAGYSVAV
jgi:hypothetical protein